MAALSQHFAQDVYQEQPLFFHIIVLERQIYAWIGVAPPRLGSLCLATPTPLVRRRRRCRCCLPIVPIGQPPTKAPPCALPLHQDPLPAATTLLRAAGSDDELVSMSQRLGALPLPRCCLQPPSLP